MDATPPRTTAGAAAAADAAADALGAVDADDVAAAIAVGGAATDAGSPPTAAADSAAPPPITAAAAAAASSGTAAAVVPTTAADALHPPHLPATLAELAHTTLRVTPALPAATAAAPPFDLTLARVARPELQAVAAKQCDLWAWVWTAGSVAADVVAALPALHFAPASSTGTGSLRILEIGAGSGVASLAALATGAHVWASDLVPDALALLRYNAHAAGVAAHLSTRPLDWNAAPAVTADALATWLPPRTCDGGGGPDLVVAADVLYMSAAVPAVWRTLRAALDHGGAGTVALVVDPGRPSRDAFEDGAGDAGCTVVHRLDLASLPTPVALMRAATIFIIAAAADTSALAATRVAALHSAATALRARCIGAADSAGVVPPPASAFGYTLK